MRIRFADGREIPAVDHRRAHLLHLMELRQQTREYTEDGRGLGMRALAAMWRRSMDYQVEVEAAQAAGAEATAEPPDDAELWTAVILFLSRRAAGDRITFTEAADVAMGDIEPIPDPGDQGPGDGEDPTTPGSGGPATPEAPDGAAAQA